MSRTPVLPVLLLLALTTLGWTASPPPADALEDGATVAQVAPTAPERQRCCSSASSMDDVRARADRWYPALADLVSDLADSYAERNEPPAGRATRLSAFTLDVLRAVDSRPTMKIERVAWPYAATLVWIAHRETRIAANPKLLGDQDHDRAAGPWQMWDEGKWKGRDRWSADTALDMLVEDAGAWSLPEVEPWVGYPEAAAWIASHPPPEPRYDVGG
jgi:hypothetical protein